MNGVTEPSVAKRLKGTPERIELENYRLSMMREEELQEVPEETLAEHNLSSVLDKATDIEEGSRYPLIFISCWLRCSSVFLSCEHH